MVVRTEHYAIAFDNGIASAQWCERMQRRKVLRHVLHVLTHAICVLLNATRGARHKLVDALLTKVNALGDASSCTSVDETLGCFEHIIDTGAHD
jgi:hypothetical protein